MSTIDTIQETPITAVLACLTEGSRERDEFVAGLDKVVRQVDVDPGPAASTALSKYVREWAISLLARKQATWRAQIEESEAAIARGDLGQPMSAEGLRAALKP